MRIRGDEWHEKYTLPSLWRFFAPNRENHASYWYYWTTADEIAWRNNFRRWMPAAIEMYEQRCGRLS